MKCKQNKGFTLTEMLVVIAVSGIFLSLIMVILSNSFKIFNNNADDSYLYSDVVVVDDMVSVFIDEVNKNGLHLKYDGNLSKLYTEDEKNIFEIDETNRLIIMGIDSREQVLKKQTDSLVLNINILNDNTVKFIYINGDEEVKQTIVYVLGGVSNV